MSEHTPGPWQWEQLSGGLWVLTGGPMPTPVILTVDKNEFGALADAEANRCLIATAPDLYETLKRIIALADDDEHEPTYAWKDAFEAGARALAKAEGRPES